MTSFFSVRMLSQAIMLAEINGTGDSLFSPAFAIGR